MRATTNKKSKTLIIIIAAIVVAAAGFTAGMLAKSSLASKNKDIGLDAAKQIALSSVGVSAEKATFTKEVFDDGKYEIDFYTNTNEYDFEINADTGAIVDKEVAPRTLDSAMDAAQTDDNGTSDATIPTDNTEATVITTEPTTQSNNDNSVIGVEAAKNIALKHAGLSSASFQEAYLDYDDGRRVYDIEFISGSKNYDYEIDANSGQIIKYDIERVEYDDYYDWDD